MITPLDLLAVPEGSARWTLALLTLALKSGVLLLAALLLMQALRGASAALRHFVLSLALAVALMLPVLAAVVPLWRVPLVPAALAPYVSQPAPPAAEVGAAALEPRAALAEQTRVHAELPRVEQREVFPAPAAEIAGAPAARTSWLGLMLYLWLAGAGLLLLRLAVGMLRLRALARRAEPITDERWMELAWRLKERLELTRPVPLLRCDVEVVPLVWGAFRPVILLPAAAEEWTEERREVVLLHELSHVKRRDPLAHLIAQLCHAAYWFNPLVWITARRLREERERACDDHVIAAGTDPAEYANHLLQIVRSFGTGKAASPALAMARRSQFEGRMLAILEPRTRRRGISRPTAWLAAGVALGAALPLAALSPALRAEASTLRPELAMAADSLPLQVRAITGQYRISEELARAIVETAHAEELDVGLAVLLVRIESNFQQDRVSPRGAVGLTQILRATAATLQPGITLEALAEPRTNLRLGFRYLRQLLDRYEGDVTTALAAYHTGPRSADRLREVTTASTTAPLPLVGTSIPPTRTTGSAAPPQRAPASDIERMVRMIGSDGNRGSFLIQTLSGDLPHSRLLEVIRATELIGSSGERQRVLTAVLERGGLGQAALAELLSVTATIPSDGDKAAVLIGFLDRNPLSLSLMEPFFAATNSLTSPGDHASVLHKLLAHNTPGQTLLAPLLDSAARIGSDGDKVAVLVAIAGRGSIGTAMEARYLAAVETIRSDGDRQRALSALTTRSTSTRQPPAPTTRRDHDATAWTTELYSTHQDQGETTHGIIRARNVFLARDGSGIDSIQAGGRLIIEERDATSSRSVQVSPGARGQLGYRYLVDGQPQPLDAAAGAWFAQRIARLHKTMKGQSRI
ncbi:hypothetical protein BH23GEM7_BH23GEM7_08850 [soil metagenome]